MQDRFGQTMDIVPIQGQPAGSSGDPVDPPTEPEAKRPKYVPGLRGCLKREHPVAGAEQQATRPPPGLAIEEGKPPDTSNTAVDDKMVIEKSGGEPEKQEGRYVPDPDGMVG